LANLAKWHNTDVCDITYKKYILVLHSTNLFTLFCFESVSWGASRGQWRLVQWANKIQPVCVCVCVCVCVMYL